MTKSSNELLFTPGPLTTSATVKAAMTRDLGSRDSTFINIVDDVRQRLLALAGVAKPEYEAVIVQGSGTFVVEATVTTITPPSGKWLVLINGEYGRRIARICEIHGIRYSTITFDECQAVSLSATETALKADADITHVAVVHCETTTGLMNPVEEIGQLVARYQKVYFVDAMSSFGAVPLTLTDAHIDYLASSSNKCIEGVPGFGFVLARHVDLVRTAGLARTLSLDLHAQWIGLEKNGQFRFTPPIQVILAFSQALDELDAEGGVAGRAARYRNNHQTLIRGMRAMGFRDYVPAALQGYIINTFTSPTDANYNFSEFYSNLSQRGMVIYPGKLTQADTFRIGNIGRLYPTDIEALLNAISDVLTNMGVQLPVHYEGD